MTIQCTECGSQFEVPQPALKPNGPEVECVHCGATLYVGAAAESLPDDHGWLHAPRSSTESGLNESDLFGSTLEGESEPSASGAHSVDVVPQEAFLRPGRAPPTLPGAAQVSRQPTLADELFEEETPLPAPEGDNWLEAPESVGAASAEPLLKDALPPPLAEEPVVRSAERKSGSSPAAWARGVGRYGVLALGVRVSVAAFLALTLAAGGTIYLNGGKLDPSTFSESRLKALVGSGRGLVTRDVSNGLYETRSGASVFYVRGIVENRGTSSGWVNVHAELFDGSQLLKTVEGLAGPPYSPEDLFRVESAEEASAFNARQGKSVAKVSPGQQAPFLLAVYDLPPDLSGFQIRITASIADYAQSAAR